MNPLTIAIPPEIHTPRLSLREPQSGDAAVMFASACESIEELIPWMPWAHASPTLEESEVFSRLSLARHAMRQVLDWRIYRKEPCEYVGNLGLHHIQWETPSFEIGYWIRTPLTGCGYATEAVAVLTDFAFAHFKDVRVEGRPDERNLRSRRVLERAGFELEGILRNNDRASTGRLRNICVYSRINPTD